jgi:hypothetical protein
MKLVIDTMQIGHDLFEAVGQLADWLHENELVVYTVGGSVVAMLVYQAHMMTLRRMVKQSVDERVANKTRTLDQSVMDLWRMRRLDADHFDAHVAAAVQRNATAKRKANLKQNKPKMPNVKSGEQV